MKWITIKLMQYQLKKAKKKRDCEEWDILARAYGDLIRSYESAIMFLHSDKN